MALNDGTRLGHYDVTALLGEGGMGQVWQATDTQLNRDVALKILPDAFATDPDRLARFKREAQILASLNHPNIAAIYGIEEAEGTRALVLELVEGPTLADRIAKGPIPLDEALPIARQIAEALETAHEAGVIHRDLKPANIKVREDGTVKVLDFGLAKALDPNPEGDPSQSPTLTAAATQMGVILGTAAYMSPEQAAGQTSDKRSDAWSFGVVLYEMLTGQRLFTGETVSHVLAKVLDRELDLSALTTSTPPPIRRLLRRCLERKPKRRLSDLGEALSHLEEARAPVDKAPSAVPSVPPVAQPSGWRQALPLALGISAVAVVITALAVWSLTRPEPVAPGEATRFAFTVPATDQLVNLDGMALSPDGRDLVYVARRAGVPQLFHRAVGQIDAVPIRGTEEGAIRPFFSPDGEWVGFVTPSGGELKKIRLDGGLAITLCPAPGEGFGGSWHADGTIVFATVTTPGVMRVSAEGGTPEPVTTVDADVGETFHDDPVWLPTSQAVLFARATGPPRDENVEILVQSLATGERRVLTAGFNPQYLPTGYLVFARTGGLWAAPFDATELVLTGEARPVVEDVQTTGLGYAPYAVASNCSLAYLAGDAAGGRTRTLVWVDREGQEESVATPPRGYVYPRISPDGTQVALDVRDQEFDIWTWDVRRETLTRLTFDPGLDRFPVWTPDGRRVVFSSVRAGAPNLFWKAADGTGAAERLTDSPNTHFPHSLSPDGTWLVFEQLSGTGRDLVMMSLEGDRAAEVLLGTEFNELNGDISPDGNWLAYESNASGRNEVYVRPFPDVDGGQWLISTDGGRTPLWAPDGRELFYREPRAMMVVPVQTETTFAAGNPELLFEGNYFGASSGRSFDIAPDGERFLMITQGGTTDDTSTQTRIVVVENWLDELAQRVPVP